jgi:hypothetical protein
MIKIKILISSSFAAHIAGLSGEGTSQGESSVIYAYADPIQFN